MDWELREVWGDNAGVRIHSFEWVPRTGAPGLPIVFIGGGNGNAWRGEPHGQAAALGRIGARRRSLLSVSRRGFGLSDAPPSGYTPSHFAGDVRAVVESAGYEGFVLFGHSMGVPISLELALASPRGIAGVALGDAPAHYINFKASHTFDAMLARPFEFESWDAAFDVIATKTADPAADRLRFDRSRHRWFAEVGGRVRLLENRNALARTVDESADAETAYWDRLRRLRCLRLPDAGFARRAVPAPLLQILFLDRREPAADRRGLLAHGVGEIRADLPRRAGALHGVAAGAGAREERFAPNLRLRVDGSVGIVDRGLRPGRVLVGRMGDDRDQHVGMSVAAELGALTLIRPGSRGLDPHRRDVPGYRVLLATQVWDEERMDHVLRAELELHLRAHGDVELLAGHERRAVPQLEHLLIGVGEGPRPLAALDPYGHRGAAVDVVDVVEPLPRQDRERDHHHRRDDRPDELERVVSVDLLRGVARPVAEPDSGV